MSFHWIDCAYVCVCIRRWKREKPWNVFVYKQINDKSRATAISHIACIVRRRPFEMISCIVCSISKLFPSNGWPPENTHYHTDWIMLLLCRRSINKRITVWKNDQIWILISFYSQSIKWFLFLWFIHIFSF